MGASREEIDARGAERYWQAGVRHIVALRGDPAEGESGFRPHPEGYANAAELVAGLKKHRGFRDQRRGTSGSASRGRLAQADLDNLKRKMEAGATPRHHPVFLRRGSVPALP